MAVPERLRAKVGKREITFSLGTRDAAEAKLLHVRAQAEWRERFRELDRQLGDEAVAAAPTFVDAFLSDMAGRNGAMTNVIFGLQTAITMRLFIGWGREEFDERRADRAFAYRPGRSAWRGADFASMANIIPAEERDALLARIALLHRHPDTQGAGFAEALAYLLKARQWDVVRIELLLIQEHSGVAMPAGSPLFDAVAEQLLRRLVEFSHPDRDAMLASLSKAHTEGPVSIPLRVAPVSAATKPARSRSAGKGLRPLSEGFAHWVQLQAPRPQSEVEARRAIDRFIALNGDLPVEDISRDHLLDYRDFISRMPTNLKMQNLLSAPGGFRAAVEKAIAKFGDAPVRTLSPGAIKKDMGALGAVLTKLRNEGWIPDNVSAGISVPGYSKTRRGQRVPRLPLRPSMMEKLFASSLFTGCEGRSDIKRTRPGPWVFQDELYWSFLFGATAGPRIEEIGQIHLDDIEVLKTKAGVQVVAIYITGTGEDESIKNDESWRVLMVHPRLLDVGFLDYVRARRDAGAKRLFDLEQTALGKWTQELSRRVNRYIDRVVTEDPRYVFHSLRHEFKDRAEQTLSTRVHDRITGHAPATAGGRYGLGASVEHMARELEKLDLSFIDWPRLQRAAARSDLRMIDAKAGLGPYPLPRARAAGRRARKR